VESATVVAVAEKERRCSLPSVRRSARFADARGGFSPPDVVSRYGTGTMAVMKETELWQRLQLHLGAGYFRVWASEYSLATLGQRTVVQALSDGIPCKIIWRAVWAALELPARDR
jgi:Protein of unknown function (DUF3046)